MYETVWDIEHELPDKMSQDLTNNVVLQSSLAL